ncbi:PRC-barrel domain containing protein [Rhodobacter sp. KR11]|jgi:hypothetical protein|uniref:PRC-barrel domain containing protein n=1 Tax=Rhodobacter sp. KR11 TaxID=2974588 RepID=UPI002223C03C|nr:PRC-barrel domain containing protein [Rhodobacter sp. KR11]MCW1917512.1 PRC-barrel domain containing protein [Rhodobacter sp. KR11]
MDHASNVVLDAIDFTPETLQGARIFGDEDHRIGQVTHVHGMGPESKVVVEVGGFLGIGAKSVQMDTRDMTFMRDDDGKVHGLTSLTKAQVHALPEHRH